MREDPLEACCSWYDILVERNEDGTYAIRLLDDWLPNVYIPRRYVELAKQKGSDPKTREYLKQKIQAAEWLKDSIEQRRKTLEKVTRAIIEHQKAFLEKGPEHIEPLKMQQIADIVGVHVTTSAGPSMTKWVCRRRAKRLPAQAASSAAARERPATKRWRGRRSSKS